jgi:branched-chain amino acid aminotransferase
MAPVSIHADHRPDAAGRVAWSRWFRRMPGVQNAPLSSGGLQYGLSVFEGLKAYRDPQGRPQLFRAEDHARRLNASARRLAMPEIAESRFLEMAWACVRANARYLPPQGRGSLYLRPTLYANEPGLGLRTASCHGFSMLAAACANPDFRARRLWAEQGLVRAAPGGLGAAKTGANYAASMLALRQAQARGYDDVAWLDAEEHRCLTEAGTMNLFVVLPERVLTPPLDGTILAGITRDSVIQLLGEMGYRVEERRLSLSQLKAWSRLGALRELFGVGTAARLAPIESIDSASWGEVRAAGGALAAELWQRLADLQEGRVEDRYGWRQPPAEAAMPRRARAA